MASRPGSVLEANFRIVLASDYHAGAGHGRPGGVDSALFTEDLGNGEVPTIRDAAGPLRSAAYKLLGAPPLRKWRRCGRSGADGRYVRDAYCRERPLCPLCRIFGSPARPSPWSFSSLRPAADQEEAGVEPVRPRNVVSRTSVDPKTRRAEEGKLFSEELGAPLTFEFSVTGAPEDDERRDELAFLLAAARTIRGVGAGRRRGRGEAVIHLADCAPPIEATDLWTRFESRWLGGPRKPAGTAVDVPPSAERRPASPASGSAPPVDAEETGVQVTDDVWVSMDSPPEREWTHLRLVAVAEEPVIVGRHPSSGNLLPGRSYVAGSQLLGAVAGWMLGNGHVDAQDPLFLEVFRGGGVLFPDLLPARVSGDTLTPLLPAPRDLHTCRVRPGPVSRGGHGLWSSLEPTGSLPRLCPGCSEEAKSVRLRPVDPYLERGPGAAEVDADMRHETKIEIDPGTGVVQEESLYYREAIPAGTIFTGVVHIHPDTREKLADRGLLSGPTRPDTIRIGKRHRRGYGKLRLEWTRQDSDDARRAMRAGRIERWVDGGWIPIVCTSPLLLRDSFGRYRQRLEARDLGLCPLPSYCAVSWEPLGGYWRHIGLPRRVEYALAPGSALCLRTDGLVAEDRKRLVERLRKLDRTPALGERTEAGCGRFEVAPPVYDGVAAAPEPPATNEESFQIPLPNRLRLATADPHLDLPKPPDFMPELVERLRDIEKVIADHWSRKKSPDEKRPPRFEREPGFWRAVARVIHGKAGATTGDVVSAVEAHESRLGEHFSEVAEKRWEERFLLNKGEGRELWLGLKICLEKAGAERLPPQERARRTRALAEALLFVTGGEEGA